MGAAATRARLLAPALLVAAGCTSVVADARTFDNTRWRVTAINGQATPAAGDYRLEFRAGQVGGRFGCNSFGGAYSVAGETIVVRELASTLMGCPEPSATFEATGFRVLQQPLRWSWTAGLKMTLSNSAGSIRLERLP